MNVILGNPDVIHSVPTAFMMNAVGTEWITSGLPRMYERMISRQSSGFIVKMKNNLDPDQLASSEAS